MKYSIGLPATWLKQVRVSCSNCAAIACFLRTFTVDTALRSETSLRLTWVWTFHGGVKWVQKAMCRCLRQHLLWSLGLPEAVVSPGGVGFDINCPVPSPDTVTVGVPKAARTIFRRCEARAHESPLFGCAAGEGKSCAHHHTPSTCSLVFYSACQETLAQSLFDHIPVG